MKKIILFLFFSLVAHSLFSQMTIDSIKLKFSSYNMDGSTYKSEDVIMPSDTVIDGYSCHEIRMKDLGGTELIRYTENGDSVLFYNTEKERFQLLYDFTKEVGDTIYYEDFPESISSIYIDSFAMVVTEKGFIKDEDMTDSLIYMKLNHITYSEASPGAWGYHIQYLGCEHGFFPTHGLVCAGKVLGCATINGDKSYIVTEYLCGSSNEELRAKYVSVSIFPNPVQDEVSIDFSPVLTSETLQLDITNLLGQSMLSEVVFSRGVYRVNVADFPSGAYILVLKNEKGEILFSRKIWK